MTFKQLTKKYLKEHIKDYLDLISNWNYVLWQEENFLHELPKKWDYSFAVYDEDKLAGFCIASNKIADAYYIHLIFISAEARRKSLGKQMLEHAKAIAKKNGVKRIELRCPESNIVALGFYQQAGFKTIKKIQDEISGPEADYYLVINF